MALLPCSVGPHRAPGRNRLAYLHMWGFKDQRDSRVRLCVLHYPLLEHDLAKYEWLVSDETMGVNYSPTECFSCGQVLKEEGWHFSVTAYPAQDERKDYWTRLHLNCTLPEWAQNGEPL